MYRKGLTSKYLERRYFENNFLPKPNYIYTKDI